MATIEQLDSGNWRAKIRRRGIAQESQIFPSETLARRWAGKREADLVSSHITASVGVADALSFSAVAELYFKSPRFKSKADSTQKTERVSSKPAIEYFRNRSILTIDAPAIQEYFDARTSYVTKRKKALAGNSLRLEKALLSCVFKFARLRKLVTQNPMLDSFEMLPCHEREVRVKPADEAAINEIADVWSRLSRTNKSFGPWLFFVRETGSRPGESARILLSWLDLDGGKVEIPRAGQKKRKPRLVILSPDLVVTLRKQVEAAINADSSFLFWSINTKTKKCVPFAYHKPWASVCRMAGLVGIGGPHALRHEFISRLYEYTDFSDGMIAALVGDVNIMSLAPYRHLRVAALRGKATDHAEHMAAIAAEAKKQIEKAREVNEDDDEWMFSEMAILPEDLN